MKFSELNFVISPCNDSTREILAAELNELGFEGFVETNNGFSASIAFKDFNKKATDYLLMLLKQNNIDVNYTIKNVNQENWNAEWEKNFSPVIVDDICVIRAPFHNNTPKLKYEILIQPNMTFGTGHHETTSLMIKEMLHVKFHDKNVIDFGCGTGILSVLASMLQANQIVAIDVDPRAYENTLENIQLNKISNIEAILGTSEVIKKNSCDILLANVSKNLILSELEIFVDSLTKKGTIICSGYYEDNVTEISEAMKSFGLTLEHTNSKNNWAVAYYSKQ